MKVLIFKNLQVVLKENQQVFQGIQIRDLVDSYQAQIAEIEDINPGDRVIYETETANGWGYFVGFSRKDKIKALIENPSGSIVRIPFSNIRKAGGQDG